MTQRHSVEYFKEKYGLSLPHSEVQEFMKEHQDMLINSKSMLDLGCGRGRNALYLAQYGGNITAYDKSNESLSYLRRILKRESIDTIIPLEYDINSCGLSENAFELIVSTVVLMFVNPTKVPDIITNMKQATRPGGYNIIVVAMDTNAYPCTMPFSSPFKEGQLQEYFSDWTIHKYNEDLGHLHKIDKDGNPIALQFATIVAQNVS